MLRTGHATKSASWAETGLVLYRPSSDLPQMDGSPATDARDSYIGMSEAAELIGVNRTQVWRFVRAGRIPYLVFGTQTHPVYVMKREDVEQFARVREQRKARARIARMRSLLRRANLSDYELLPARPIMVQ